MKVEGNPDLSKGRDEAGDADRDLIPGHAASDVQKDAIGANAYTVVKRSEFNAGKYAPNVSDEVRIDIAVEAIKGIGGNVTVHTPLPQPSPQGREHCETVSC